MTGVDLQFQANGGEMAGHIDDTGDIAIVKYFDVTLDIFDLGSADAYFDDLAAEAVYFDDVADTIVLFHNDRDAGEDILDKALCAQAYHDGESAERGEDARGVDAEHIEGDENGGDVAGIAEQRDEELAGCLDAGVESLAKDRHQAAEDKEDKGKAENDEEHGRDGEDIDAPLPGEGHEIAGKRLVGGGREAHDKQHRGKAEDGDPKHTDAGKDALRGGRRLFDIDLQLFELNR